MIFETLLKNPTNKVFKFFINLFTRRANHFGGDYISNAPPIVIGGCARSGTTLLRVMLDSHKNICCGPESDLFVSNKIGFKTLSKNFNISYLKIVKILKKARSRAEFIELFFNYYCKLVGKQRWAEKSPRNIEYLNYIYHYFPNARVIHIIRDGRDVACSLRTFPRYKVINGKLIPLNTWKPIKDGVKRWIEAIQITKKFRSDSRYIEINYEDLVLKSESTLKKLLDFINEPWDINVLHYYKIKTSSRDMIKFPQNPEATNSIKKSSIGRWKRDFNEEDKKIFKKMAGNLLIDLGYESSNEW